MITSTWLKPRPLLRSSHRCPPRPARPPHSLLASAVSTAEPSGSSDCEGPLVRETGSVPAPLATPRVGIAVPGSGSPFKHSSGATNSVSGSRPTSERSSTAVTHSGATAAPSQLPAATAAARRRSGPAGGCCGGSRGGGRAGCVVAIVTRPSKTAW